MPNMDWDRLAEESRQKFGAYGEYFAKMELASYGMDVYTSEVDDRGIDFVCLYGKRLLKIQVKSIRRKTGYAFMKAANFDIEDEDFYLLLLLFEQGQWPKPYLIPATAWQAETPLLRFHHYDQPGQSGEAEYGVHIARKHQKLLEEFRLETTLNQLYST